MSDAFAVWDARDPQWLELWREWPAREVFAHPAYVELYASPTSRALCASWRSSDGFVLYPFVLRDLTGEPFCPDGVGPAYDVTSAYGYGGAFAWGGDPGRLAPDFWAAYDDWAAERGVVSEFVRLALFEEALLPYPGEREERLENVVRTLEPSLDEVWIDFEHKVRKNVKKARRSGVTIEIDERGERLDDFLRIYRETMTRRGADASYDFQREFFDRIGATLGGHYAYFHALASGSIVSSELVLVSAENVYSFLGGTDEAAFDLRPNDLLKHEVIRWAKESGKRRFVLGGGAAPGDGIVRYKASFAPRGRVPFVVGRRVLAADVYEQLTERRVALADGPLRAGYFPAYRA